MIGLMLDTQHLVKLTFVRLRGSFAWVVQRHLCEAKNAMDILIEFFALGVTGILRQLCN